MYSIWNCQYLMGGGKRCQAWLKSFILRKTLLHKRSRTCKSFFLYIPRPPTPQSLKHSYPKKGYHPTTVFISSSGLQTSPICFSSATPETAAPGYDGLITSTAGRAELRKSQFNTLLDNWHASKTTPDQKGFITFIWNKTHKKQEAE